MTVPIDPQRINYALFFSKVRSAPSGCREWHGRLDGRGYGTMYVAGQPAKAHRVAWVIAHGEIPEGKLVCHHCDNPRCVRDDHLFLGTQADNMADCARKGRGRKPSRAYGGA